VPIYEYRCPKCGVQFERLIPSRERDQPQPCPEKMCGEKQAKKIVSQTTFLLKGGGWAADGYSG